MKPGVARKISRGLRVLLVVAEPWLDRQFVLIALNGQA